MSKLFRTFSETSDSGRTLSQLRFRRIAQYVLFALSSCYALIAVLIAVWRVRHFSVVMQRQMTDEFYAADLFNLSCISLALLVLAVLIAGSVFGNEHQNYSNRIFVFCLYSASLSLFLNFCYQTVDGVSSPVAIFINYLLHSLYFMANATCIATFALYFCSLFPRVTRYMVIFRVSVHTYLSVLVVALIANIKHGIIFYVDEFGLYQRGPLIYYPLAAIGLFLLAMFPFPLSQKIDNVERSAILIFLTTPLIGTVLQVLIPGFAFSPISIFLGVCILYVYAYSRSIHLAQKQQIELQNQKTAIMLSQIQPHFLFNSLSSVAMLCGTDPEKAKKTAITFTKYLRGNLNSLSAKHSIPFSDELNHTQAYLEIESVRFGERLKIVIDTPVMSFDIPSLTLQPMVENAVKHGVCMKPEGGTVWITTSETPDSYVVEIRDDGVGFDMNDPEWKTAKHIGIINVRNRLRDQADGLLVIESRVGVGTVSKIILPKEDF